MDSGVMIYGTPIIITTRIYQVRKHKKKRINKKWLKRYGVRRVEVQKHDEVIHFEGKLYMTEKCYWAFKKATAN